MFGEAVVAAVVSRHRHNRARAVAGQHVFRNPDGQFLARKRVQGVGARKHAAHLVHFRLTLALGAVLGVVHVGFHFGLLFGRGEGLDGFVFGAEHHEADPEKRVGACGEYFEPFGKPLGLGMVDFKAHFRAHAAANPVALHFLERVAPFQGVQTVQEALGVGGDTQRPLFHQFAFHGEAAAFGKSVYHFVVGQHRAQLRAPVHHRIRKEGQAVVHQNVGTFLFVERSPVLRAEHFVGRTGGFFQERGVAFLFQAAQQLRVGQGFLCFLAIPGVEQADKDPLRPKVVGGVAGLHFAVPVEGKAYEVELLAVAFYVLARGFSGVLPGLNGVLFGGQSVGVESHRVQYVIALQPFVSGVDVAGDIAEGMPHVQAGPGGVGEHVQNVVFGLV